MTSLFTLALLYLAALMIPGPNMILLTHTAASVSRPAALATALGISVGTLMWVAIAVFGMKSIFDAAPVLQTALRLVGGLYLLYLAWGLTRDVWGHRASPKLDSSVAATRANGNDTSDDQRFAKYFRRGLLTNATNPKSLAFWSSVAVVSIDPNASLAIQIASVVLVAVMGLGWHIGVAFLFSTAPAQRAYLRVKPVLSVITSIIMAGFGVRLLASLVATRS
jgi:threonine efflux protein